MEGVTSREGTAPKARIPGYRVAGKTGTTRIVDEAGYTDQRHVALFVGVAPLTNPRMLMVVVVNDASGPKIGGGAVAAPVFARVAERALRLMEVPPDGEYLAGAKPAGGRAAVDSGGANLMPVAMGLRELVGDAAVPDVVVAGLAEDSRTVRPNDAFVAVAGATHDGHDFASHAITKGAVCVLAERRLQGLSAPVVVVAGLRGRRGELASRFYGEPSRALRCVGVTGTNGKTSVAHHIADLAAGLGQRAGYLGTLGWGEPGCLRPTALTTADAVATQRRLARLRGQGCAWACLEASSHALAQGRVDAVRFEAAVFTNLTRDHLDYHGDFAAYGAAKRRLFEYPSLRRAIINIDDAFGRELARGLSGLDVITVGGPGADIGWEELRCDEAGVRAQLRSPWGRADIAIPQPGEFSLANVAAAIAVLAAGDLPFQDLVERAERLAGVPGRMEVFRVPGHPPVVVDYAHTPDALAKALGALAAHCRGRLICVVGCGGNRDPGKRPLMARAAARAADVVWLTSDNPRWEAPSAIIGEMRTGLIGEATVREEVSRAEAIAGAIAEAEPGDWVVIAGRGHETHVEIRGERIPFSDRDAVRDHLHRLREVS